MFYSWVATLSCLDGRAHNRWLQMLFAETPREGPSSRDNPTPQDRILDPTTKAQTPLIIEIRFLGTLSASRLGSKQASCVGFRA